MKLIRFGGLTAILAGTALVGCSSETPSTGEGSSTVGFTLLAGGVDIDSVSWDLNTQAGADVANDSIPVPNDGSQVSLGIDSLAAGQYSLAFSASGTYLADGQTVSCTSAPVLFTLAPNQDLTLPPVTLTCQVTVGVADTTGSVDASVQVVVEQIPLDNNIVQVFSYGPRSVDGVLSGSACTWPPVAVKVHNPDATISYAWSADSGSFTLNASQTQGTFNCNEMGPAVLTLTATKGSVTAAKSVTVQCAPGNCEPPVCGDGVREGAEECDEVSARCTNCVITPACGDGVIDGPNGACFGGTVTKAACDEECDDAGPSGSCTAECTSFVPFCGDGIVNQPSETCDNGSANSNTEPNACRTNCQPAFCGDNVVDTGEQCDAGPTGSTTCTPQCTPVITEPGCLDCIRGDAELGAVQTTYCDPLSSCTAVQVCVADSGCFLPVPGACYCGPNTDACRSPSFDPVGACEDTVRAAATVTGETLDNATILDRFFDFNYPLGIGMLIYDQARQGACQSACVP